MDEFEGTPPDTVMTPAYVELVGRLAYFWGWPLVNNYNRSLGVAALPEPGRIGGVIPGSPHGQISMLTDYIDAAEHFVTCPNQDTVYGAGFQNLDTSPAVVQVPDFGDRFYTYQIGDARTDSFGQIGKQYGSKPGHYLIVGPGWEGEPPEGITGVLHSPTNLVTVFPRVFMDDTREDREAVRPLINQILVYPLAEFDGTMKTKDWASTPNFPAPPATKGETQWVIPEKFFDELPRILKDVPVRPGEEALYTMFNSLMDAAAADTNIKAQLQKIAVAAEEELIGPLLQFHNNGRRLGKGWTSPSNGARWGFDYLSRTATARSNMYDNAPEETRYIYTDFDADGARLNGANSYSITFAKGETPPVDGFWSLTLYNKEHLFEPNPLNRFSLGTKNKNLVYGEDGSLTLYAGSRSPGGDKEANWLPAPDDDFSLYIRAYWPGQAILDRSWQPPAVVRGV